MALVLVCAAGALFYFTRATTLTVAVAQDGDTELLLQAYADELARRRAAIRLKLVPFAGTRESAGALASGKVDLAVVRPDVTMPGNGLTLAILQELAVFVVAPARSKIKALPDLAGKRLGVPSDQDADRALVAALITRRELRISDDAAGAVPAKTVALVAEGDLAKALADGRVDAVALVTTPTSPLARRVVAAAGDVGSNGRLALFGVPDATAVLALQPLLQSVTIPAALYDNATRVPDEDVATVGASFRLMARTNLSRDLAAEATQHLFEMRPALAEATGAAENVTRPAYEDTADATTARLPIHPGAIDYYERDQQTFIERYEDWIYLVAILGGGLGSTIAWLRQRLGRIRRERIEVATARLLQIRSAARHETDRVRLEATAAEVDDLAAGIARHALDKPIDPVMLSAARVAIDAARSTVARAAARANAAEQPNGAQTSH